MRKILLYTALLFLVTAITSCDEYLEEKTYTELVGSTFPLTVDDAEVMLNGAYSRGFKVSAWAHRLDWLISYATPETMYKGRELHSYRGTTDSWSWELDPPYQESWMDAVWECVRSANDVIALIPDTEIEEPRKSQIIAEAKFIRANMYFYLVRMYGACPIVDKAVNLADDLFPAKASLAATYEFIVQDLKDADACPTRAETISQGRLGACTSGAAAGLLAKVYVTMASAPLNDASKWQEAKIQIDKVKGMGYGLITSSYADLFDWKKENNEEWLFSWQSEGNTQAQHAFQYYVPKDENNENRTWIPAPANGISYDFVEPEFAEWVYERSLTVAGDTSERATFSIVLEYIDKTGKLRKYNASSKDAAYVGKYRAPDYPMTSNNKFPTNRPVLRYADILLLESEVLNELGIDGRENGINAVRARADLAPVDGSLSKDDFRLAVIDERTMELCFEHNMFFDMRRMGFDYCKNLMENYYNPDQNGYPAGFSITVEPREMLFPWPQKYLDDNSNLVQNPGY